MIPINIMCNMIYYSFICFGNPQYHSCVVLGTFSEFQHVFFRKVCLCNFVPVIFDGCACFWNYQIDGERNCTKVSEFCPELSSRPDWWPNRCLVIVGGGPLPGPQGARSNRYLSGVGDHFQVLKVSGLKVHMCIFVCICECVYVQSIKI